MTNSNYLELINPLMAVNESSLDSCQCSVGFLTSSPGPGEQNLGGEMRIATDQIF